MLICALFYPGRENISVLLIRNQITTLAGGSQLSLSAGTDSLSWHHHGRTECLLTSGHSIAQMYKRGKESRLRAAFLSSRRLKADGHPERISGDPGRGKPCHYNLAS